MVSVVEEKGERISRVSVGQSCSFKQRDMGYISEEGTPSEELKEVRVSSEGSWEEHTKQRNSQSKGLQYQYLVNSKNSKEGNRVRKRK